MNLIVGTVAGAFSGEDPTSPIIDSTRINHLSRDVDRWWAVDGQGRVHRDGEVVASGPDGVILNCVLATPDAVFVGAERARLYRLDEEAIVVDEAFATAPGREGWYTPWGGPPDVRSLAVDASGTLFVNVHVGGILRHDGDGYAPTLDQDADVHQVIADPEVAGAVFAACAYGLAQSGNGRDFEFRDRGLHAPYCRAVAVVGDTVLISASTGPRSTQARLYGAPIDGGRFEPCRDGLPEWFGDNLDSHCLAVVEGTVYAGQGGTVWHSPDQGSTWTEVASGFPNITCLA